LESEVASQLDAASRRIDEMNAQLGPLADAAREASRFEAERDQLALKLAAAEREVANQSRRMLSELEGAREALAQSEAEQARLAARLESVETAAGAEQTRLAAKLRSVETALREETQRRDQHLAEQAVEITVLTRLLHEQERAAAHAEDKAEATDRRVRDLEEQVAETTAALGAAEARLAERFEEIAALSCLLRDQEIAASRAGQEAEWVRQVASTLLTGGQSWRGRLFQLLPGFVIRSWIMTHLKHQGLFDAEAYLRANADVASAGANPLRHYIHHGMREGRDRG
jgi:chromosome segregation ATPase